MTLREHLFSIESVVSLADLGRRASRAALAAHRAESDSLEDGDRDALMRACEPLIQLRDFSGVKMSGQATLQSMAPIMVLEETFDAVSRIDEQRNFRALLDSLIDSIDAVTAGSATDTQIHTVKSFFSGLAEATLTRTTELTRRRTNQNLRWTNQTLISSEV